MRKKVLCSILVLSFSVVANDNLPPRPINVPKAAEWDTSSGMDRFDHWVLKETRNDFRLYRSWRKDGKPIIYAITYKDHIKTIEYSREGYLSGKSQKFSEIDEAMRPGPQHMAHEYGKTTLFFDDGKIGGEVCFVILPVKEYSLEPGHSPSKASYPCGESWGLNTKTREMKKQTYPDKCLQGCGEFKPFMPPGKYKVHATNVIFRDKPSTKGKSLGTLTKGTELQVIEDTHKIETHDFETAPWVKVKVNGKTGYVFGGFLDSLERNDL